jgi:hypothetical protein
MTTTLQQLMHQGRSALYRVKLPLPFSAVISMATQTSDDAYEHVRTELSSGFARDTHNAIVAGVYFHVVTQLPGNLALWQQHLHWCRVAS